MVQEKGYVYEIVTCPTLIRMGKVLTICHFNNTT